MNSARHSSTSVTTTARREREVFQSQILFPHWRFICTLPTTQKHDIFPFQSKRAIILPYSNLAFYIARPPFWVRSAEGAPSFALLILLLPIIIIFTQTPSRPSSEGLCQSLRKAVLESCIHLHSQNEAHLA